MFHNCGQKPEGKNTEGVPIQQSCESFTEIYTPTQILFKGLDQSSEQLFCRKAFTLGSTTQQTVVRGKSKTIDWEIHML